MKEARTNNTDTPSFTLNCSQQSESQIPLRSVYFFCAWSGLLLVVLRFLALTFEFDGMSPASEFLELGSACGSLFFAMLMLLMRRFCSRRIGEKFFFVMLVGWGIVMSQFYVSTVMARRYFASQQISEAILAGVLYAILVVIGLSSVGISGRLKR